MVGDNKTSGKFIPDEKLCGRDNSGGSDMPASLDRCAEFGDGKKPAAGGDKSYLK